MLIMKIDNPIGVTLSLYVNMKVESQSYEMRRHKNITNHKSRTKISKIEEFAS